MGSIGGERGGWEDWGGITLEEIPNVYDGGWRQQTTMACVYLCNNPARSTHVPQNLKYNKIIIKERKKKEKKLITKPGY